MSDPAIGLTVVAFGTSAPELVVNLYSTAQNHTDIVFGNVIGRNIFNLLFILGIAGLITPLAVKSGTVWKEIPLSLLAAVVLLLLANGLIRKLIINRAEGCILLVFFGFFLWYIYRQLFREGVDQKK